MIGYLNLGDIKGNSQDAKHKEWIELLSITHQAFRNIDATTKPRDALSKSQVQLDGIEIQKNADESSPELVYAVCSGRVFPTVTIDLVRVSPDGNEVFYQWKLDDAYISEYGVHGQSLGEIATTEHLTLNYSKVTWIYFKKDEKGKPQGSVEASWNLGANSTK